MECWRAFLAKGLSMLLLLRVGFAMDSPENGRKKARWVRAGG